MSDQTTCCGEAASVRGMIELVTLYETTHPWWTIVVIECFDTNLVGINGHVALNSGILCPNRSSTGYGMVGSCETFAGPALAPEEAKLQAIVVSLSRAMSQPHMESDRSGSILDGTSGV